MVWRLLIPVRSGQRSLNFRESYYIMKNGNFKRQTGLFWTLLISVLAVTPAVFGQTDPGSLSTQWMPVLHGSNFVSDPSGDEQAGNSELDIVGNGIAPSLYMQSTDGYLGFRLRLGANTNPLGFDGCALIGLDMNLDGALDLFVGVDNQGNQDKIGIWAPGSGANTSPKNTSVGVQYRAYSETFPIYNYSPISSVSDPTYGDNGLNTHQPADQFLSFFVPLAGIKSALAAEGIVCSCDNLMSLVAVTSTQLNSLNADICGVNGGINSCQSWTQLGATNTMPIHLCPVPEPAPDFLFALAGGVALLRLIMPKRRP